MSIFGKLAEDIDEQDILDLIKNSITEKQNIEYKSQVYGRRDKETREMLKDITSMANASGGYIFLGINEGGNGLPTEIVGIEKVEEERDRIHACCISSIEPRITGLKIQPVEISIENKTVLVVYIPRSTRAPHMVTHQNHNKFWMRHDRQKSMMSVDEIRDSFSRTENIVESIDQFLKRRREELLSEVILNETYLVLSAAPLTIREEVVDIHDQGLRDLLEKPPGQRANGWNFDFNNYYRCEPTLNGLKIEWPNHKTVELFANGYLEAIIHLDGDHFAKQTKREGGEHPVLNSYAMVEYPVGFFRILAAVKEYLGMEGPYFASLSLYNLEDFGLNKDANPRIGWPFFKTWPRTHLEISPRRILPDGKGDKTAKIFVDKIWQAFGYERAPLFNEDGNF